MIEVEYHADGTETDVTTDERKMDGRDERHERTTISRDVRVHIDIEFQPGYVNLEAFAPDRAPDCVAEDVADRVPDNVEIDARTIECDMTSTREGWLRQARRWISERPNHDVISALETFDGWSCTNSSEIQAAIGMVESDNVDVDTDPIVPDRPEEVR